MLSVSAVIGDAAVRRYWPISPALLVKTAALETKSLLFLIIVINDESTSAFRVSFSHGEKSFSLYIGLFEVTLSSCLIKFKRMH